MGRESMAADHSEYTKNTFIDIDTREMDAECTRDTRRNKTWHASAALPFFHLPQKECDDFDAFVGDSTTRSAFRFKTHDFLDEDDVCASDDVSTSASEAGETVPSPLASPRGMNNAWDQDQPQLVPPMMLTAPAPPVLLFRMPVAELAMQSTQNVAWSCSPSLSPAWAPVKLQTSEARSYHSGGPLQQGDWARTSEGSQFLQHKRQAAPRLGLAG